MTSIYEIPLSPTQQVIRVTLSGVPYTLTFIFRQTPDGDGGWIMDIGDVANAPIICGIPLVTGADLIGQYRYLGIGGAFAIGTDGDGMAVPGFNDLGVISHLYYIPYSQ